MIRIGARSTWVRTNDNIVIVMPNSEFIVKPVVNWTATDRQVRFCFRSASPTAATRSKSGGADGVAAANPDVLARTGARRGFPGFGDSTLDFELRVWTVTKVQTPLVLKSDLYFAIFDAFKKRGIEIPFPQRDLHLRTAPAAIQVRTELRKEPT